MNMFAEAVAAILRVHCTPAQVRAIESGASPEPLVAALREAGFLELMAAEEAGGGGAGWSDLHAVVSLCGAHAMPIPLAQTLAARVLVGADEELPRGLISFAPVLLQRDPDSGLHAPHVPGGRTASHIIAARGDRLVLLDVADAQAEHSGVHASGLASFAWPRSAARVLAAGAPADALQPLAALLHAALMAGAMKRAFDLSMAYANERVQFGKAIGKFQAIQHQLSVMAELVAAAGMAAEAAFSAAAGSLPLPACAVAKARASEAAQQVASMAHAIHGAIGVTEEYELQLHTRRLHEWRMAHGSESHWNRVLGRVLIDSPLPTTVDFARGVFSG